MLFPQGATPLSAHGRLCNSMRGARDAGFARAPKTVQLKNTRSDSQLRADALLSVQVALRPESTGFTALLHSDVHRLLHNG